MKKCIIALRFLLIIFIFISITRTAYADNPPFKVNSRSAALINAISGQIIFTQNPDEKMPPASLTKLMTLFVTFDEIAKERISLSDEVIISKKAWKTEGSRMFLEVGTSVPLEQLIKGIAIVSANDSCVAVAEFIAGVEEVFVEKMNKKASDIGMTNSVFKNSHGLPDDAQHVTAMDIATLAYHYLNTHPDSLKIHSVKEMIFNNIKQQNRNGLLWLDYGVDGLKTGWVSEAGYHIVATAYRNGDRFISVVMGANSEKQRENAAIELLNYAFKNFKTIKIDEEKTRVKASVWNGAEDEVPLGILQDVYITLPVDAKSEINVEKDFPDKIFAPISKKQVIGQVRIIRDGKLYKTLPLLALESIEKAGFFKRTIHKITIFFISPPYMGVQLFLLLFMVFVLVLIVKLRKKRKKKTAF